MLARLALGFVFAAALTFAHASAAEPKITVEKTDRGAVVQIDGQPFTEYLTHAASGAKPLLWPLIGPTGKAMTRAYPLKKEVAGESNDHPWQASCWFDHGEVNGVDFWADEPLEQKGKIVHQEFKSLTSGAVGELVAHNHWMSPNLKQKICEEDRQLRFGVEGDTRWIEMTSTLTATEGPLHFGDTKEGSFGVRMADTIKVDAKQGGKIVNSRGQTDAAAWGQPAEWVDYHGPVAGETVGLAILDHPDNLRFPTRWHVRTYGLFAANPFGQKAFGEKAAGGLKLKAGAALTLRYRIILHAGDEQTGEIAEAFETFSKSPK